MRDRIADYYPRYRERSLILIFLSQLITIAFGLLTVWLIFAVLRYDIVLAIAAAMVTFVVLNILLTLWIFKKVSEPVKIMTFAINHVSKQLTDLPPPDINQQKYIRSGLKNVVQTVYDLALNAPAIPNAIPTSSNAGDKASGPTGDISQALIEALPCGVIGLNKTGEVIFSNQKAPIRIAPGAAGKQMQLLFDENDTLDAWRITAEKDKVRDTHIWSRIPNKLPDEENRQLFDVIANYEKGSSSGYDTILITVDRTGQYARAEEDMDFIALAAHELRGPTTVIKGYLDVLSDELGPVLQADQRELFERINVSANRLGGYINNILNVSRFDRRHMQLHLHEERLDDIVHALRDDLDMRARTQNRLLNYNLPTDLPTIAADRNSLNEVISNLVDNAIKYSHDGGQVIVNATVKGNFVECTVQDFGIGIPASVAGNLFSKFYRSHVSRSSVAGTGLGLYISKAIIESHGGQMWVNSVDNEGSTFGFSVPIYATVAEKLQANNNENQDIIESAHGWIKNHAMVRK